MTHTVNDTEKNYLSALGKFKVYIKTKIVLNEFTYQLAKHPICLKYIYIHIKQKILYR